MLVCPQCQFENPDSNKFCQTCGTSLTQISCSECGALVPTTAEHCPQCGADSGVIWRAVLSPIDPSAPMAIAAESGFLDPQHRYQLLEPLPIEPDGSTPIEVRVLDLQPFQPSWLEVWQNEPVSREVKPTAAKIPAIAHTYLDLQSDIHSAIPKLHDAWEHENVAILLLQDWADHPALVGLWGAPGVLTLQILHWLHQMVELWKLLEPVGACRSLLELDNLRVDEDHLLCLRRLYLDPPETTPTLRELGKFWQNLFMKSQRTQLGSLARLCVALEQGEIIDLTELKDEFDTIADELQPEIDQPVMPSDPLREPIITAPPMMDDDDVTQELLPGQFPEQIVFPTLRPGAADLSLSSSPTRLELAEPDEDITSEGEDAPTVMLPMKLIGLDDAGLTDIGKQRDHNEDFFSIQTEIKKVTSPSSHLINAKGLYILCDGMGGHAGGEVASALAGSTLREYFNQHWGDRLPDEATIREGILQTNKAIFDQNQQNESSGVGRMGTTLVLMLVHDTQVAIAHVGDSRLYRYSRRGGLEQVTLDHEVGQREILRGVEPTIAYARPDAFQLTQALGPRDHPFVNPEVQFVELNEDVLLLLCSDGLSDNDVLETNWRTHVEPMLNPHMSLEQGVEQLITLANQQNGHDNITAVAVRVRVRPNLDQFR